MTIQPPASPKRRGRLIALGCAILLVLCILIGALAAVALIYVDLGGPAPDGASARLLAPTTESLPTSAAPPPAAAPATASPPPTPPPPSPTPTPSPSPSPAPPTPTPTPTSTPTATSTPTSTPVPPTATPTRTPSPTATLERAFISGGLGLSINQWEALHGPAESTTPPIYYENKKYIVVYFDHNVWNVTYTWGDRDRAVPLTTARAFSKGLLPADSQLIKTHSPRTGNIVDLYSSASLVGRFGPMAWSSNEPRGHFVVIYHLLPTNRSRVTAIEIGVGSIP